MKQPAHILTANDCAAWVQMRSDGLANVHVIRQGYETVTVLGVRVREAKEQKKEEKL